ncbi:Armadillo repeat-containing protein 6-like [Homarus americanus]|uniref:Armadillo repeat-containing protein 6-like n=1 Tax=Homarus americanus TaxID=6706 RepID=A0A8J5K322_HOMAM|nr:Armadillo repeat-containing protein 6-like [Homarus americanus]
MAKVVYQETFDSVVLENVTEFDSPLDEAIDEAIKEFEAQGVHLGIIVKNMRLSEDKKTIVHDILIALEKLRNAADGSPVLEDIQGPLTTFSAQCKVSIAHRARWSTECCLKHEVNRQNLVAAGALGSLVALLQAQKSNSRVVKATSKALRAYTLDDDIRQAFGKAHEHARLLAEEHGLIAISLDMIKDWLQDSDTASELLSTVGKLCVRAEYCQEIVDHGALHVINNVFVSFPDHPAINKQAMSLLKAMVGNDKVKTEAMKSGVSQLIIAAIIKHQAVVGVCEEGFGALSMLALRVPAHAKQIIQAGGGQAIIQAMKIHYNNMQLQKLGCMAIRNIGCRVPENRQLFIEYGVEEVINSALQNHGEPIKDVAKAALRDLDLKVDFVEQWRGTGHEICR